MSSLHADFTVHNSSVHRDQLYCTFLLLDYIPTPSIIPPRDHKVYAFVSIEGSCASNFNTPRTRTEIRRIPISCGKISATGACIDRRDNYAFPLVVRSRIFVIVCIFVQ